MYLLYYIVNQLKKGRNTSSILQYIRKHLVIQNIARLKHAHPTLLPNRPGPMSVFCSPVPLPDTLSAYRTFPTDKEQQRLLLRYICIICVAWLTKLQHDTS